ncbi:MAG: aminotransferase class I/II-fold pyridoxal phosphate-dependent enzyme [Micrococcaceae bacterium]
MDAHLAPAIVDALQSALDAHDTGYPGGADDLVSAFSDFTSDRWNWKIKPDQVTIHVDVATAGAKLMRHYSTDGQVIVMPPNYNRFFDWIRVAGLTPREVPLRDLDDGAFVDLPALEEALRDGTRVILFCNPHNPLGRVFSHDELNDVAELAARYEAVVISDEIHAPLVHPGVEYTPWMTVSETAQRIGIALHAATKPWNFAGLKCGLAIRSPEGPWPEILDPNTTRTDSGLWGIVASAAAYRDGRDWVDTVAAHFQEQTRAVERLLAEHLPGVTCNQPQASYLVWLNFKDTPLTEDPAVYFLREARVKLNPGTGFGSGGEGYARFNIGTSAERIERIITAMGKVWPPAQPSS